MFLTQASESDIIKKIKEDSSWLTQERLQYIIEKRIQLVRYLKPENVDKKILKKFLKEEKTLLNFASIVEKNEDWKVIVQESIPRPLTYIIFKEYGVLLNFVEEKEYQDLAKDWIKTVEKDTFIPQKFINLLTEKQVLSLISNRSLNFQLLSKEVKTKEVCLAFLEKTYQPQDLYKQFSQNIKDDADIAYIACKNDKQFYKSLTPKAQCGQKVIKHVIDSVIYPAGDYDSFHTDETAINPKNLSLAAILSVDNIYTMKRIFDKNKTVLSNKEIQEKWFTDPQHQEDLIEYFEYFPQEVKEIFKNKLKSLDSWGKAINLVKCQQLRDVIIDESNIKDSLVILFAAHMNSKNFNTALAITGLKSVMDENLSQYISQYTEQYNHHHKERFLDIADWLLTHKKPEYKQVALELLSIVLKNDPDALKVDFNYHYNMESHVLKKIASEVYEYMDSKDTTTRKNKKM